MGCRHTLRRLASHVRRPPQRRSWLAPTLTSHQELDAGIAARQQADRKNLKKSKRPFANYFRAEYRTSPTYATPAVRTNGHVSSYHTVQVMTNPNRSWTPFWGRGVGGVRIHGKRQDVLEQPLPQFGDDGLDRTIERLLELRFQWDREDEMLAPSLVPPSMCAMTEHCLPFTLASQLQQRQQEEERKQELIGEDCVKLDGEKIPLSIFRTRGRRKGPLIPKGSLGFNGVDTIPAIILDATRGPLVSSPTEITMNVRWKATNREAASVSEMLRLHQSIGRVPVIGLPTRSLLLLLKVYATSEVENPALAVSLAIAGAEHYHEYTYTQCLELLRCLRRVAYVKGLAHLSNTSTDNIFTLYHDATRCQMFFADYIRDAAPFLTDRVWSRLPEHVQRLTRRKLFIDLTDLLMLAVELQGGRLPRNLPNPVSSAVYASKYLFLRYTLQFDDEMMMEYVKHMTAAVAAAVVVTETGTDPDSSFFKHMEKEVPVLTSQNQNHSITKSHNQEVEVEEECEVSSCTKPFIVWLSVSFFVRLIAEALGDVLRHVEISLKQHVQLAKEYEATATWGGSRLQRLKAETNLQRHLDRIAAPFPRHSIYQRIGRKTPKKLRLRLIPLDVFLDTFRRTRQAPLPTTDTRRLVGHVESPFAAVLSRSALAEKHIRRACDTLDWAAMMLTHCTNIVKRVPTPVKRAQRLDISAEPEITSSSTSSTSFSSSSSRLEGMDDRFVWCEALVRSRVQNDIDCLFIYVPWQGLEEQMQTLAGEKARDNVEEKKTEKEVNDMACVPDACFLLDLLAATSSESEDNRTNNMIQGSKGEERQISGSTTAEQKAQKMLEALQDSVERFQLAVSNLIDAQEEYFLMV